MYASNFRFNEANSSTSIGIDSGPTNTENTFLGDRAGEDSTGEENTAIGFISGYNNK